MYVGGSLQLVEVVHEFRSFEKERPLIRNMHRFITFRGNFASQAEPR